MFSKWETSILGQPHPGMCLNPHLPKESTNHQTQVWQANGRLPPLLINLCLYFQWLISLSDEKHNKYALFLIDLALASNSKILFILIHIMVLSLAISSGYMIKRDLGS